MSAHERGLPTAVMKSEPSTDSPTPSPVVSGWRSWTSPREWDWIPHLLVWYGLLFAVFVGLGVVGWLFAPHAGLAELANDLPSQRPSGILRAVVLLLWGVPLTGVAVTMQVIRNELRWRRTGDPRA